MASRVGSCAWQAFARLLPGISEDIETLTQWHQRSARESAARAGRIPSLLLLVGDSEIERRIARKIVEKQGVHTLVADDIDAGFLVLDMFPGIDGALVCPSFKQLHTRDIAQLLRWRHPELPVVLVATHQQLQGVRKPAGPLLVAPYTFRDLVEALHRAKCPKPVLSIVKGTASRQG